jgi:DNA repair protein RecN (Recombination protein N)
MGEIMKEMSQTMQILPLPIYRKLQLKVMHFKVSKSTVERTQSELKLLTDEERIIEIAQMLSGAVVSDSALKRKALLN